MKRGRTGRYETTTVGGESVKAFIPRPLPPDPPLDLKNLHVALEQALLALGRLDSLTAIVPDSSLILYSFIRKEAVLSSQIEGTQSSLSDLLLFELHEAPGVPVNDVVEVSNYVASLDHGLKRLREDFPLSNRLLREIHGVLLSRGRGSHKDPGNFRRSQNWIGGTRPGNAKFVPPPPQAVPDCMKDLELFLHDEKEPMPVLVKAGLAHVQFETIHPFLDGNGRLGRLLITFLLCNAGILREPLLYLSLYFKQSREDYYQYLDGVRTAGDWEAWLGYYLQGVRQTADNAVATAQRLIELFREDREKIQREGRAAGSALRVHGAMQERPLLTMPEAQAKTSLSFPAVSAGMKLMARLGIVKETTGKRRDRVFAYSKYLAVLDEGTKPLSP
jgi:Fic family protein